MEPVLGASPPKENLRRIHRFLQHLIQIRRTADPPLHGSQHLDIPEGIHMIIPWKILRTISYQSFHYLFIALLPGKKEIRIFPAAHVNGFSPVDPMRIHNDPASLRLPEDPGQTYHRDPPGINDILQDISRAHTGQLIRISHQDQGHMLRHRL